MISIRHVRDLLTFNFVRAICLFNSQVQFPSMHAIVSFIYFLYDTGWFERAGLGDRFFQLMVGLTYALHLNGT